MKIITSGPLHAVITFLMLMSVKKKSAILSFKEDLQHQKMKLLQQSHLNSSSRYKLFAPFAEIIQSRNMLMHQVTSINDQTALEALYFLLKSQTHELIKKIMQLNATSQHVNRCSIRFFDFLSTDIFIPNAISISGWVECSLTVFEQVQEEVNLLQKIYLR